VLFVVVTVSATPRADPAAAMLRPGARPRS
jgi:hypothetical protein